MLNALRAHATVKSKNLSIYLSRLGEEPHSPGRRRGEREVRNVNHRELVFVSTNEAAEGDALCLAMNEAFPEVDR